MISKALFNTAAVLSFAASLFSCSGEPGKDAPVNPEEPLFPDSEIVLTSQKEVDEFARKTLKESYPLVIKSLTVRGSDITDISSVAVNEVETLTVENTSISSLSNNFIETVYDKFTVKGNPELFEISSFLASRYDGDIVVEDNAVLDDISFLLLAEKIKGNIIFRNNPLLGEDREGKSSSYGLNPVLSLLEGGLTHTWNVTLENNHPGAATNPMQIGRLAHVSRWNGPKGSGDAKYEIKDGKISEAVLNNYLSRAITEAEYLSCSKFSTDGYYGTPDDERMLLNIGAKFIGRSMYEWGKEVFYLDMNVGWFDEAIKKIDSIHEKDPDVFFQAGLFEIVTTAVDRVPVPYWVFEAFGKKPEKRNFSYSAITKGADARIGIWGVGTCVPNMSNEETQMWFYYKAVRFMEIGIEALHCGQINLMSSFGDSGAGFPGFNKTFSLIRKYAREHNRRGIVLIDAHCTGYLSGGVNLLDSAAYPIRLKEKSGSDHLEAEIVRGYIDSIVGRTISGMTPSGWYTSRLPYLLEFDNFGTSEHEDQPANDHFCWGYDEISWISNCTDKYGAEFVEYAVNYLASNDPMGHLEMPGLRGAVGAKSWKYSWATSVYRCNTRSADCPAGRNLESTIKRLWSGN
ncbi:MAG: hypothetical protein MJY62_01355 [Bacteroidales bacterium]|nr:hypothetical protein [Bacteroidales bacterium]